MTRLEAALQQNEGGAYRRRDLRRAFEPYVFIIPTVVILVTLLIYPLFYTVQASLSNFDTMTFAPTSFAGFRHYERVLQDNNFWTSLRVTGAYLLAALPLQVILGVAIAFLVSVDWPGTKIVRALFVIPMVVAPVVAGSMWKMLLDPLWGYINYLLSLLGMEPVLWLADPNLSLISIVFIDTWRWTPFIILIILAGIVSLDVEPIEAAKVDGANWLQRFFFVILPMLRPVILSAFVVRWLGAIKMFDIVFTATGGGPGNSTEVINMYIYKTAFRSLSFDRASAMSVLMVIAAFALTFLFIRLSAWMER